jgi:ribonuclease D
MFKESITKEELIDLPLRWFEGDIYIIEKPEQVNNVAEFLSTKSVIGFDTETRPSFKKGVINKVALLQLSTQNEAFLFRVNKLGLPAPIRKILANPDIIKAGVAIRDDIKALQGIAKFNPAGFIEFRITPKIWEYKISV